MIKSKCLCTNKTILFDYNLTMVQIPKQLKSHTKFLATENWNSCTQVLVLVDTNKKSDFVGPVQLKFSTSINI